MPLPVEEHDATLTGRTDPPVGPLQRLPVLPLLEQPPGRPHRLDHITTSATGQFHDFQYEAAVTAAVEGHIDGGGA